MATNEVAGKVVNLSLKLTTFQDQGKQERQPRYVWTADEIQRACLRLLDVQWPVEPIRLIRVGVSELTNLGQVKKD